MVDVRKIRLILELREQGISDSKVLSAIEKIPRDLFIPENFRNQSYENIALPIGNNQTISQPLIVAIMTSSLNINKNHKVLEIGTGSGYQTSIISLLCRRVYTIERIKSLLLKAEKNFSKLKLNNIVTKHSDGNFGWEEQIPFDRIIITAATTRISKTLINHLKDDSIIIAPIIEKNKQVLTQFIKKNDNLTKKILSEVVFVPNLSGVEN